MELRVSAQDKEISDDDDDRNHKHRRRDDTRLQSLDDDDDDDVFTKPYRRGSKPSQNGSHSNEKWKKYSFNPLGKDKGFSHFLRGPSDLNQKLRVNQQFSVDHGSVWSQSQPFSVDPHGLFAGRGSNSWGPFGLDMNMNMIHHPLGLQATFRPPSLNMGLTRQRCRDFEEQGFCLRGDMCPMEHGMNHIVVEDVQSLSQFNLPVSLPSANLSIVPAGIGPSPSTITTTNSKSSHGKNIKHVVDFSGGAAADFYDPDQPLWGNASHTPAGPQPNDSLLDASPSDNSDHELFVSTGTRSYAQGTSRIKKRRETEENMQKNESGNGGMIRKPSQKAQRTLFLNGIPHQNNKRETLISHFKRFGEVIDIYIPLNSERAFVQFSKREEAEAALMSPDAVMGNRFIKLWWANRDNIPFKRKDDSLHNDINAPVSVSVSASDHPPKPVAVVANGTKEPRPPLQKKLENLEVLKEELRKKQEMLDQKRNDFRLKLDKLAKQTTFLKGEVAPEQVAKKQKSGGLADSTKAASSDVDTILPSPPDTNSSKSVGPTQPQSYKTRPLGLSALQESPRLNLKSQSPVVVSVSNHRFKLDHRPTAFKIIPPLPDGLAHVSVLKEHFSAYGDFSKVQLDLDDDIIKTCARIYFTSRHAAEKAFLNGKKWKAHNLHFTWLINSNSTTCKHHNSDSSNQPTSVVLEIPKTDYSQKLLLSSSSGDGELDKREIVKEPEQEEEEEEESNQSV
ncbi:unnamed protein product [Lactuca virosa]|uniref:Zinc finger CCCH domain-containing protein 41 n=1 Tax=Lactuca virosa TaxID=75947 RepID=A0AAU9MIT4_9ASTR|nr:unnamed protein product [Lactuca virosa]